MSKWWCQRTIVCGVVAALGVLLPFSALAQDRYGTIEGRIADADQAALPGVTVTVQGENMMGQRTQITDAEGRFRFALVPPGYVDLTASLDGFTTMTKERLPVSLGRTSIVDLTLPVEAFEDSITVVADPILIDTTSSQVGANIDTDFVVSLPTDRNYQTVMKMLPSVVHSNNPIFKGASGGDNMYLVDGADSTDPATNTWAVSVNFDNLQEVQMIDGGVPAEYGKGTGAVVNLVTKSGSNEFHGVVRLTYSDEDLNSDMRGDSFYFDEPERYVTEVRPSANVGGPILRDKLWFFASYERRDKEKLITRYDDFAAATAGIYSQDTTTYSGHYLTGKLTYQPTVNHTIFAQYIDDPIDIPFKDAYDGILTRAPDADRIRKQGGPSFIVDWTGVLSESGFINVQYSGKRKPLDTLAMDSEGPIYYSPVNGGIYWGSSYSDYHSQRDLDLYKASYEHFISTGAGSHQLKGGVEYSHAPIGYEYDIYASGEYIRLNSDGSPNYRRVYTQRRGPIPTVRNITSVFVQDRWQVNQKLTLNVGIRFEDYVHENNVGTPILDWGFGDRIQPRLGMAYAVGTGLIRASASRYHDSIGYELPRDLSIYPDEIYDYYTWDEPTEDWAYSRTYVLGADYITVDPNLESPYMDEYSVGYEGKLSSSMKWSVDATYRDWKNGVEADDGRTYGDNLAADGNPHYLNLDSVREYRGVELKLTKRLAQDHLQFIASYNYSETEGYWGNDDEDSGWGANPYRYINQWGRVYQDRPHTAKFFGTYYFPLGFVLGSSFVYQSGIPYETTASVRTSSDGPWGRQTFSRYNVEPRGSRRLPATWLLDLRVEKEFHIGDLVLGIYVDIFNVTDNQEPVGIDSGLGTITLENDQPGAAYTVIDPNGSYLTYTEWQAPRSYFFGAKLAF